MMLTLKEFEYLFWKYYKLLETRDWYFLRRIIVDHYGIGGKSIHDRIVRKLHLALLANRISKRISNMNFKD